MGIFALKPTAYSQRIKVWDPANKSILIYVVDVQITNRQFYNFTKSV